MDLVYAAQMENKLVDGILNRLYGKWDREFKSTLIDKGVNFLKLNL